MKQLVHRNGVPLPVFLLIFLFPVFLSAASFWQIYDLSCYCFGPEVVCTASKLHMREKPDISSSRIGELHKDQLVKVIGIDHGTTIEIDGISSCWVLVETFIGKRGWVFGGYLEDLNSAINNNDVAAVEALLTRGVDPNIPRRTEEPVCDSVETETYPLYTAVKSGSIEMVDTLIPHVLSLDLGRIIEGVNESPLEAATSPQIISRLKAAGAKSGSTNKLEHEGQNGEHE